MKIELIFHGFPLETDLKKIINLFPGDIEIQTVQLPGLPVLPISTLPRICFYNFLPELPASFENLTGSIVFICQQDPMVVDKVFYNGSLIELETTLINRSLIHLILTNLIEAERIKEKNCDLQQKLDVVFDRSTDLLMLVHSETGKIFSVSKSVNFILGYSEEEVLNFTYENLFHKEERIIEDESLDLDLFISTPGLIRKDGSICYMEMSIAPAKWHGENITFINFRDITHRKTREEQIYKLAYFDRLTGLPKRNLFIDKLGFSIAKARDSQSILLLALIDIDSLRLINDIYGHKYGDKIITLIGQRLEKHFPQNELLARYGGDEFFICFLIDENVDEIQIINDILDTIRLPFDVHQSEFKLTISIGCTMFPLDSEDKETLIKYTEMALKAAKENGKNTYSFFAKKYIKDNNYRLNVERKLRAVNFTDDFTLYFQPQINTKTNSLVGVEVLLRWLTVDGKSISPAVFIPIIEEIGMVNELGEMVLKKACQQAEAWKQKGIFENLKISINISPLQFNNPIFPENLLRIMKNYQFNPENLVAEITESVLMKDSRDNLDKIKELQSRGVQIAIDDFGTGYSSFKSFKNFAFDYIKIDKEFINDLARSHHSRAIVSSILSMAEQLELKVVAEGVENKSQLDVLVQMDCQIIQGYYYSMPLCADEFEQFAVGRISF